MMRGSSSRGNLDKDLFMDEVEALLLQQQRNHNLILEREKLLNINRSGSAPPTVEGALGAAGSLFNHHNSTELDFNCSNNKTTGMGTWTEEEIRSHPSYLEYYYSHENLNPRLPPPLLSKEDWRIAQRVKIGAFGSDRNVVYNSGSSSFFSVQQGLSVNRAEEEELVGLRKTALRNLSRKNSAESLEKVSSGLLGGSSSGMGVRRKSFADILQEGISHPVKSHLTVSTSQNSVASVSSSTHHHDMQVQNKEEAIKYMIPENTRRNLHNTQNIGSANPNRLPSGMSSSSTNPRTKLVRRPPSPSLANLGHVHRANGENPVERDDPNATSSSIFEIADIAASLSGLNMSEGLSEVIHDMNSAHIDRCRGPARCQDVSKSVMNDRVGFPRRTLSSSELQSHSPEFSGLEDFKAQCWSSILPAASISNSKHLGYLVGRKPDMMARSDPNQGSHQMQYMQQVVNHGMDSYQISRNSCQGNHLRHPHEDMQVLEKAYLEALLIQQAHLYQSHLLQNTDSINHHYHGNLAFGSSAPSYHRNILPNMGDSSRIRMLHSENVQMPPSMRSITGDSTGSLHSHNGSSGKWRLETLLQVFKNDKTKTLELPDILGRVVEFSMDQIGSRFIQEKLETATTYEKMKILAEIIPHAHGLAIDVFGNYVIQKFFEHGTESQKKELMKHLITHVLPLSLHMYGCRVVQKALEVVDPELQAEIAKKLDGSVMKCVHDQNGNHVIQKCIECIPQDRIQFILSSFLGQVVNFSTHPYGCRVIQRVLEHCDDPKMQEIIMDEIISSVCMLAEDQYGNYVIQHVVQHGKPQQRSAIISKLAGQIVKMSQQKFASNVVEKCLSFGSPEERQLLVNEMLGQTDENEPLQAMMKDPFGNYVVQKMLETCDDKSRKLILSRIKVHLDVLKRYTYGKHIVSRVEKLVATGERQGDSSNSS